MKEYEANGVAALHPFRVGTHGYYRSFVMRDATAIFALRIGWVHIRAAPEQLQHIRIQNRHMYSLENFIRSQ